MTTKEIIVVILIIIAGITATGLSAYQYYDGVLKGKETDRLTEELKIANNKLQSGLDESRRENMGYGIPKIELFPNPDGTVKPIVKNEGNYPIYNIQVNVVNYNELIKNQYEIKDNIIFFESDPFIKNDLKLAWQSILPSHKIIDNIEIGIPTKETNILFVIVCRHTTIFQYCIIDNNIESHRLYELINGNLNHKEDWGAIVSENIWMKKFINTNFRIARKI